MTVTPIPTWLVWCSHPDAGETEKDALRIPAWDAESAAEEWAQRDTDGVEEILSHGLELSARQEGESRVHRIHVRAEAEISYYASEVSP